MPVLVQQPRELGLVQSTGGILGYLHYLWLGDCAYRVSCRVCACVRVCVQWVGTCVRVCVHGWIHACVCACVCEEDADEDRGVPVLVQQSRELGCVQRTGGILGYL